MVLCGCLEKWAKKYKHWKYARLNYGIFSNSFAAEMGKRPTDNVVGAYRHELPIHEASCCNAPAVPLQALHKRIIGAQGALPRNVEPSWMGSFTAQHKVKTALSGPHSRGLRASRAVPTGLGAAGAVPSWCGSFGLTVSHQEDSLLIATSNDRAN